MANHFSPIERCTGHSTLHYVSAAHGGWGIVRIAALVPESYLLFVCPFACGRHTALGSIDNGIKDQVSYLFITEGDIISGGSEQLIIDNVGDLFEALPKRPKVLFIFTSAKKAKYQMKKQSRVLKKKKKEEYFIEFSAIRFR